uniref:C2 domain-containing protein n=1 Tax=Chromera velia CCMP2878 TaxID=1169474 RepID=A0A0G4I2D7_9ALVE|eukprot:Cvel_10380.t1-p1 / transcript=Cvel_10380.t1 / gene=Cvel_10380 / organism=Chromera_velia_CCMP2878 / gene_product=hypothetical protein / transcript_product=hypothetical protein / location=Cvel_scaffold625:38314-44002(+) / protein_length=700 / sequence_SO=supercontig / SO=protein_coding / is_pseudo=false
MKLYKSLLLNCPCEFTNESRSAVADINGKVDLPGAIAEVYQAQIVKTLVRNRQHPSEPVKPLRCCGYTGEFCKTRYGSAVMRLHPILTIWCHEQANNSRSKRALLVSWLFCMVFFIPAAFYNYYQTLDADLTLSRPFNLTSDIITAVVVAILASAVIWPTFLLLSWFSRHSFFGPHKPEETRLTREEVVMESRANAGHRIKKFGYIRERTVAENLMCLRNKYEHEVQQILKNRPCARRVSRFLWSLTMPSVNDTFVFNMFIAFLVATVIFLTSVLTVIYLAVNTAQLPESTAFEWLYAVAICFALIFVAIPLLQVFITEVAFAACAHAWASKHELSKRAKIFKDNPFTEAVQREVFEHLQDLCATKIQRWLKAMWLAKQEAAERYSKVVLIQAMARKLRDRQLYRRNRLWCLDLQILEARGLKQVSMDGRQNPFVQVECDPRHGNERVYQTAVAWEAGDMPQFTHNRFAIDVQDCTGLLVTVFDKQVYSDTFVGRCLVRTDDYKLTHPPVKELWLPVYDHFDPANAPGELQSGEVRLKLQFLDPLKDKIQVWQATSQPPEQAGAYRDRPSDGTDPDEWVLPRHRQKLNATRAALREVVKAKADKAVLNSKSKSKQWAETVLITEGEEGNDTGGASAAPGAPSVGDAALPGDGGGDALSDGGGETAGGGKGGKKSKKEKKKEKNKKKGNPPIDAGGLPNEL